MTSPSDTARVRSFKVRRGRMSARKQDALHRLGPRYALGLPVDGELDLAAIFGRSASVMLDVGFGTGEATIDWAGRHPAWDVVAVDVHTTGVARLLAGLAEHGLANVRIAETDVWDVLDRLPGGSIAAVRALFPDPWPKRRHRARRLVQAPFVARLADLLADGGWFHLATDWEDYAAGVVEVLAADGRFVLDHQAPGRPDQPGLDRPTTPYEQRGLDAGRPITDVVVRRTARSPDAG